MIFYSVKVAFRNLKKSWAITLINIFGLALGLACFIAILIYVRRELSYDQYHAKYERIYKLNALERLDDGSINTLAISPGGWAPELKTNIPEFEKAARVYKCRVEPIVENAGAKFYEKNFLFADADFFQIFSFQFLNSANERDIFKDEKSVAISQKIARKYFGDADPLGKIITYIDTEGKTELSVSAVFKDLPENLHFSADFVGNLNVLSNTLRLEEKPLMTSMGQPFFHTYFLVNNEHDIDRIVPKVNKYLSSRVSEQTRYSATLTNISEIHFQKGIGWEFNNPSNLSQVYVFLCIGIVILAVACINFMNLASAQAESRVRAISIRKMFGTPTFSLMLISWMEALICALIAITFSVMLLELTLPIINDYLNENFRIRYFVQGSHLLYIIGVTITVALITGSYPVVSLFRTSPLAAMKGKTSPSRKNLTLRRALVIFQFGISGFLVVSALFVSEQMGFLQRGNIGLNRDFVVNIPTRGDEAGGHFELYKRTISEHSGVVDACGSFHKPFEKVWKNINFETEALAGKKFVSNEFNTTRGFVKTFGIQIVAGRDFAPADTGAFLLNETAVSNLGLTNDNVIGIQIEDNDIFNSPGKVIGVVKDFHYEPLHEKVGSLALWYMPFWPNFMSVKISGTDASGTIKFLEDKWKQINPDTPFHYTFLDDDLNSLYAAERKMNLIFRVFAAVAIVLASLGLFSLSKFSINKKVKEIGIRKVLGGEVGDIVVLVSKEYLIMVLVAILIFMPLSYFLVNQWLSTFAYHVDMNFAVFIISGIGLIVLCLATVGYSVISAARKNPSEVIRYE